MICISIVQESRRFALVDMLNAAPQCDLMEIRLDRFEKAVDLKEFLKRKAKPVILSCRRVQDGGDWTGSEHERLTLLRQGIIDQADYVEIELDVADQIRPFPGSKRVITYTNLNETPNEIDEIYARACEKQPDVVKLMTRAETPEEAWPLVQIVAKATVPTVVVGIGKPGLMLTVLGQRFGAPWVYAALEKGLEAYPGQPSVRELRDIYHLDAIGKGMRFIGVTGFTPDMIALTAMLNDGLAKTGVALRCLPLNVGYLNTFRKILEAVKVQGVVVAPPFQRQLYEIAGQADPMAEKYRQTDYLGLNEEKLWQAYYLYSRAAMGAIEAFIARKKPSDKPLKGRLTLIVGSDQTARMLAWAVRKREGVPIVASMNRDVAHAIAEDNKCRFVPFEAIYSTAHDLLLLCGEADTEGMEEKNLHLREKDVHPNILKSTTTVVDLRSFPNLTGFHHEAVMRGCPVVSPHEILLQYAQLYLRLITGRQLDAESFRPSMAKVLDES